MIAHLQGREQALEPFGWTGRRAKRIALACLHSGVFTRAQWTRFLGCHTEKVRRAVHALIAQGVAAEENVPGISRVCRIYGRGIYTGRTRANRRVEGTGSQTSWPGADSPRHHLADRAPLRSALPMTDLRLMPPLGCENDVGGRFTVCPVPDSHGTRRVSAQATVSYASAARPAAARRAAQAEMGATPRPEGLVRARGHARFHTASTAAMNGVDMVTIAKLLGHALVETTERYVHLSDQSVADAADRVSNRIHAALAGSGWSTSAWSTRWCNCRWP